MAILEKAQHARGASRLPALGGAGSMAALELATPLLLGAGAALATTFLRIPLRIPGSAIVFSIFPTALAVALVPRRGAGTLASAAALATLGALRLGGAALPGAGAAASLLLAGPLLDGARAGARAGWRLYAAFVLAGLIANLAAFAARAGIPALGIAGGGASHGLHRGAGGGSALGGLGLRHALLTYAACGLVAGLLSAAAWFRFRAPPPAGSGRP